MVICTDYILNLHFFFFPSISEHFGPNTKSQNVTWSACLLLKDITDSTPSDYCDCGFFMTCRHADYILCGTDTK